MESNCRFTNCQWIGNTADLFTHCQAEHNQYILQINEDNGFNFLLSDILEDTFLLVTSIGLYWFLLDPAILLDRIRRGVFAIGSSKICEYTMKIGRTGDGCITYMGPIQVRPEGSEQYDLTWSFDEIEMTNEETPSRSMQVFFGSYSDPEVWTGTCEQADIDLPIEAEDEQFDLPNNLCLMCLTDDLTEGSCPVCTSDMSIDLMNPEDEEFLLLKSLRQLTEKQPFQMARWPRSD